MRAQQVLMPSLAVVTQVKDPLLAKLALSVISVLTQQSYRSHAFQELTKAQLDKLVVSLAHRDGTHCSTNQSATNRPLGTIFPVQIEFLECAHQEHTAEQVLQVALLLVQDLCKRILLLVIQAQSLSVIVLGDFIATMTVRDSTRDLTISICTASLLARVATTSHLNNQHQLQRVMQAGTVLTVFSIKFHAQPATTVHQDQPCRHPVQQSTTTHKSCRLHLQPAHQIRVRLDITVMRDRNIHSLVSVHVMLVLCMTQQWSLVRLAPTTETIILHRQPSVPHAGKVTTVLVVLQMTTCSQLPAPKAPTTQTLEEHP